MENLEEVVTTYENKMSENDRIWINFHRRTNEIEFLKKHRDHIEEHNLGFGDRSFHYMWYLLIFHLIKREAIPKVLEIGVYKGQVISLWALLARELCSEIDIYAVSPFEGNMEKTPLINNLAFNFIRQMLSKSFRKNVMVGNIHPKEDYLKINRTLFSKFNLDFGKVNVLRGYSNDPKILEQAEVNRYDLIYIDGDHRYEVVKGDILNYSRLLNGGGFLVMDDASYGQPGSIFWKGYKEVAEACKVIRKLGFKNILNVGHNRVFQKQL